MRNIRYVKIRIKIAAYLIAVSIICSQGSVGTMSSGNTGNGGSTSNSGSTGNGGTTTDNNGGKMTTGSSGGNQNKSSDAASAGNSQDTQSTVNDSVEKESEEKSAHTRPSVTMDMEDVSILTDEMLQMAKDRNVDLILKMNDKAMWYVSADTVKGNFSDIDMNVLFEQGVIPQDLLERFDGENGYQEFTLVHDGPFGFGAELEILLNPEYRSQYANLFYYDSEAGTLEFICAEIIDENGYARFSMEHASSYVIVISDHILTEIPGENEASSLPLRWIVVGILILIALAAVGTIGYFYLQKRREEEGEEDEDYEDEEDTEEIEDSEYDVETEDEELFGEEDDWIEDDEWDISNDWMDDEEWAQKNSVKKTAV